MVPKVTCFAGLSVPESPYVFIEKALDSLDSGTLRHALFDAAGAGSYVETSRSAGGIGPSRGIAP